MELQGNIKMIGQTETFGSNGFRKRELVVTTNEQYPQHIMVEFVQDKTDLLDNFNPGDGVKVMINLRGREWVNPQGETKYFNSIQGWRIESFGSNQPVQPSTTNQKPSTGPENAGNEFLEMKDDKEEDHDDLPF